MKVDKENESSNSSTSSTENRLKTLIKDSNGIHQLDEFVGSTSTDKIVQDKNLVINHGWSMFNITVEPLNFSLLFVFTFTGGVTYDLIQRNTCNYYFHINDEECYDNLNKTEEELVNAEIAETNMMINLACLITPALLSLFIGPWSEKNGRKPFMILTFIGNTISYVFVGILSFQPTMNPHYIIMAAIPQALSGGAVGLYICCHCYLCDVFPHDLRTLRFNMFHGSALLGGLIANLIVTFIFTSSGRYGFPVIYFSSALISALSAIYASYFIQETVKNIQRSWIFDMDHLKSIFNLIIKRTAVDLLVVFLCILTLMSAGLILAGEDQIEYFIGKAEFSWNLGYHNTYSAITAIVSVLSTSLGSLILKHKLRLQNTTIIILSGSVLVIAEICRTTSKTQIFFLVSSCFMKHFAMIAPTANAEMSKHVDYEDLGKLFSFTAMIDSLSSFAAGPMYTAIYDKLIYTNQSLLTFNVSAITGAVIVFSSLLIRILMWKKEKSYEVSINV